MVLRGKVRFSNQYGTVLTSAGMEAVAESEHAPSPAQRIAYLKMVRYQSPWGGGRWSGGSFPPLNAGDIANRVSGTPRMVGGENRG